jgi:hypothetical protein
MNNLLAFLPEVVRKFIAIIVAYSTTLVGGYIWLDSKIKAAEDNAISMVKEMRHEDMANINNRLNDIRDDLRVIKKVLMERGGGK